MPPESALEILKTHTRFHQRRVSTLMSVADRTAGAAGAVAPSRRRRRVRGASPRAAVARGRDARVARGGAGAFLPTRRVSRRRADCRGGGAPRRGAGGAAARGAGERGGVGAQRRAFGKVTAFDKASFAHRVTYDDGETQWLTLWRENEVVRWSPPAEEEDAKEANDDGGDAKQTPAGAAPSAQKATTEKSASVSEALAAAEAKEEAAAAAATRRARALKAERPDAALVSCKKKFGVLLVRAFAAAFVDEPAAEAAEAAGAEKDDAERETAAIVSRAGFVRGPPYAITCLCASCVSSRAPRSTRGGGAHCGAGHAKKWRSTVRVEVDDARVFKDEKDEDEKENERRRTRRTSSVFASAAERAGGSAATPVAGGSRCARRAGCRRTPSRRSSATKRRRRAQKRGSSRGVCREPRTATTPRRPTTRRVRSRRRLTSSTSPRAARRRFPCATRFSGASATRRGKESRGSGSPRATGRARSRPPLGRVRAGAPPAARRPRRRRRSEARRARARARCLAVARALRDARRRWTRAPRGRWTETSAEGSVRQAPTTTRPRDSPRRPPSTTRGCWKGGGEAYARRSVKGLRNPRDATPSRRTSRTISAFRRMPNPFRTPTTKAFRRRRKRRRRRRPAAAAAAARP